MWNNGGRMCTGKLHGINGNKIKITVWKTVITLSMSRYLPVDI